MKNCNGKLFVTVFLGFVISLVSIICKFAHASFDYITFRNKQYTTYFGFFSVYEITHRVTKEAPSAINQSC